MDLASPRKRSVRGGCGPGGGGDVHITADLLTIENGSTVTTGTSFLGEVGGNLFLNVGTLRLMGGEFGGSQIQSVNGSGDLDGDGFPDVSGRRVGISRFRGRPRERTARPT